MAACDAPPPAFPYRKSRRPPPAVRGRDSRTSLRCLPRSRRHARRCAGWEEAPDGHVSCVHRLLPEAPPTERKPEPCASDVILSRRMWKQNYDPFMNAWLSTLTAATPFLLLFFLLAVRRTPAHK